LRMNARTGRPPRLTISTHCAGVNPPEASIADQPQPSVIWRTCWSTSREFAMVRARHDQVLGLTGTDQDDGIGAERTRLDGHQSRGGSDDRDRLAGDVGMASGRLDPCRRWSQHASSHAIVGHAVQH
jgi:hypothetical protein